MKRVIINNEQLSSCKNPLFVILDTLKNEGFDLNRPYERIDDFYEARVIFEQNER